MKMSTRLRPFAALILVVVTSVQAMADVRTPLTGPRETAGATGAAEYLFSNDPDEILVPIYLMGAVGKPGLYHVPTRTDLLTLLTLSGGTTNEAKVDQVYIRHQRGNKTVGVTEVNLQTLVTQTEATSPALMSNDFVYIPAKEPAVSTNTLLTVGLIATITSLLLGGIVAYESTRNH
jgi:hypothetical protein